MVAGYHLIWTAYGFWLPNDARGSTSVEIRVEKLKGCGQDTARPVGIAGRFFA